jgi:hypothetical protein
LLPAPTLSRWLLPILALFVGITGITIIWVAVAILSDRPCGWLALLAAAGVAFLLRLAQVPSGRVRMIVSLLACALAIGLTLWMVAATHLGFVFGLGPITSAARLGSVLAWEVTRLTLRPLDWLFIALSLLLAAWWGRGTTEQR